MADAPQSRTWCAGHPFSGSRELTEADRARVAQFVRRQRWSAWAYLLIGGAWFVACGAGVLSIDDSAMRRSVGIAGLFGGLLVAIPTTLRARHGFRRARRLQEDLEANRVDVYGEPNTAPATARSESLAPSAPGRSTSPTHGVELLPGSTVVLTVDGAYPAGVLRETPQEVTEPPAFASLAAEWVHPTSVAGGRPLYTSTRDLSEAERAELRQKVRRLWRAPTLLATVPALWFLFVLSTNWGQVPDYVLGMALAIPGVLTAIAGFRAAKAVSIARLAERDAVSGRVLIVRVRQNDDEEVPELGPPQEVLPHSGLPWTEDGIPAAWRGMRLG